MSIQVENEDIASPSEEEDERDSEKKKITERNVATKLLKFAHKNRESRHYKDVTVYFGKDKLPANRIVLASASKYFEKKFDNGSHQVDSIEVVGVDKESMEALMEFMYTGSIAISHKSVEDLLFGANHLQIEDIKKLCAEFLYKEMTVDNCCHVLEIAEKYKMDRLEIKALYFFAENFKDVTATESYKIWTKKELINWMSKLDRTYIRANLFCKAFADWTNHEENNRSAELPEIVKQVLDLHKLPSEVIEKEVLDVIKKYPELLDVVIIEKQEGNKRAVAPTEPQDENTSGKILSLGGYHTLTDVIEVYSSMNQPQEYPRLPNGGRQSGVAVVFKDHMYYLGGCFPGEAAMKSGLNTVYRRELRENLSPWKSIPGMKTGRESLAATVFQGKIVVNGGHSSHSPAQLVLPCGESYSSSRNSWENDIAPLQQARCRHALVACKDRLYAIGGMDNNDDSLSTVERLKTDGSGWEFVKEMKSARNGFAAVCYKDCIYVIGGLSYEGAFKRVEKYDPETNEWTLMDSMLFKRFWCSACVSRGSIYVVGGRNAQGEEVTDIECYHEVVGWRVVKSIQIRLSRHSVIVV